jgi:hypothetical protein
MPPTLTGFIQQVKKLYKWFLKFLCSLLKACMHIYAQANTTKYANCTWFVTVSTETCADAETHALMILVRPHPLPARGVP